MSEAARELPCSLEDWIELEKTAEIRSELEDGVLKQFSSKTKTHNELVMNFSSALRPGAKKQGCQGFALSLKTIADGQGYYPDVMLTCHPRGTNPYVEYNPCLVAEILSWDTSFRDQIVKRDRYLMMPTLEQVCACFLPPSSGACVPTPRRLLAISTVPITRGPTRNHLFGGFHHPRADLRRCDSRARTVRVPSGLTPNTSLELY